MIGSIGHDAANRRNHLCYPANDHVRAVILQVVAAASNILIDSASRLLMPRLTCVHAAAPILCILKSSFQQCHARSRVISRSIFNIPAHLFTGTSMKLSPNHVICNGTFASAIVS